MIRYRHVRLFEPSLIVMGAPVSLLFFVLSSVGSAQGQQPERAIIPVGVWLEGGHSLY
jgi:hypothetical protein